LSPKLWKGLDLPNKAGLERNGQEFDKESGKDAGAGSETAPRAELMSLGAKKARLLTFWYI